ncbi:hypothetical protein NC652_021294 [Populus alba x Populus x berolinensis]|nr:hypothetical protein NC652_021294 [Populus alba x Populus x berolinensis]
MFNQQGNETTSSELTCDSARVKSLLTRLDLAINSVSTSDLKSLETDSEFKSEALQSPVISGTSQGSTSGEYFSRVGIGKPASQAYLILDTGSDVNQLIIWVSAVDIIMINEGLFIGAAGLLGLGGGSLSFPSQIITTSFSYCLVDRGSESASTLEFNSTLPPNTVTAPLIRNHQLDNFYYVGLTGLSELVSIPESAFQIYESGNGGVIVDSGTAITQLQTDVYSSLSDAFARGTKDLPSTNGISLFDTCYNLSSGGNVEVPTVSFHFPDGKLLPLQAKNYMVPLDSEKAREGERRRREMKARRGRDQAVVAKDMAIASEGDVSVSSQLSGNWFHSSIVLHVHLYWATEYYMGGERGSPSMIRPVSGHEAKMLKEGGSVGESKRHSTASYLTGSRFLGSIGLRNRIDLILDRYTSNTTVTVENGHGLTEDYWPMYGPCGGVGTQTGWVLGCCCLIVWCVTFATGAALQFLYVLSVIDSWLFVASTFNLSGRWWLLVVSWQVLRFIPSSALGLELRQCSTKTSLIDSVWDGVPCSNPLAVEEAASMPANPLMKSS